MARDRISSSNGVNHPHIHHPARRSTVSGKKFSIIVGLLLAAMTTVLWIVNGWNATHGLMYLIGAALITGGFAAWLAEQSD